MAERIFFDVFLSHNSEDTSDVEALARRLVDEEELRPFLDIWHLVPGEPWGSVAKTTGDLIQRVTQP